MSEASEIETNQNRLQLLDRALNVLLSGRNGLERLRAEFSPRDLDDVVQMLKHDAEGDNDVIIRRKITPLSHRQVFGLIRSATRVMDRNPADLLLRQVLNRNIDSDWFSALENRNDKPMIETFGKELRDGLRNSSPAGLVRFVADLFEAACTRSACSVISSHVTSPEEVQVSAL